MEQAYSVGTTNRYALFIDEEDDPGDVIIPKSEPDPVTKVNKGNKDNSKLTKNANGKENKEKNNAQKQNKVVLENANKTSSEKTNSTGRTKQGVRSNERAERSQGERLDNRRQGDDNTQRTQRGGGGGRQRLSSKEKDRENEFGNGEDRPMRGRGQRPFRDRGERGTEGGRGGGGGRGGFRTGKREFERRSGSDKSSIKAVDKRDGGGAHNWGRQNDRAVDDWPSEEAEVQLDTQEPMANGEDVEEQKEKAEGEEGEGGETTPEEEEPKEMTLDEYKAQQSVETLKPDTSLQRNVDDSQWKGTTVALKKVEGEFFSGTREVIEKPKTSGRVKTTLDPNFYFKDQARRGRGRTAGTGGGGGGVGRGAPREDRGGRDYDDNRREAVGRGNRKDFDTGRKDFEGGRGTNRGEGGRGTNRGEGGRGTNRGEGGRGTNRGEGGGRREFDGNRREFDGNRRGFDGAPRRAGGFGGRAKNNRRGDRAPNMGDEKDFPSLGGN